MTAVIIFLVVFLLVTCIGLPLARASIFAVRALEAKARKFHSYERYHAQNAETLRRRNR